MQRSSLSALAIISMLGVLALIGAQWKLEIGDFADSPQTLRVPLGKVRIAGGGKALIEFLDGSLEAPSEGMEEGAPRDLASDDPPTGPSSVEALADVRFAIRCNDESKTFRLGYGETHPDPVCGVTVTPLDVMRVEGESVLLVEVSWSQSSTPQNLQ